MVGGSRCDAADELGVNPEVVELAERGRNRAGSHRQDLGGAIQTLSDLGSGGGSCGQAGTCYGGDICHGPGTRAFHLDADRHTPWRC